MYIMETSGFIKRTERRWTKILKNVTIEPAMFLIAFASAIDDIASDQMVILKTCSTDFGYNETVCHNLEDPAFKPENIEVSNALNQFNVYKLLVTSVFPVFFSFYLGAWVDLFGRQPLFYLFLAAYIVQQIIVIGCAYWFDSPKEYLFLSYIPVTLTGGFAAYMLAVNAFLSDITKPENRAFRYGMLHLSYSLGRPTGAPLGAYLLETGGFVCVFTTSLAGIVLGSLWLILRIRSYKWDPPKTDKKKRNTFSPLLVKDAFETVLKPRPGPNRKYIWILMFSTIFSLMAIIGEISVSYTYVRIRYNWQVTEYSTYSSITSITSIIGNAILLPLVSYLKINEAWVMCIVFASTMVRYIIKGFASSPWLYYLGAIIDLIGSYATSIARSMLSCCVAANELGKVYAILSAFDSLIPIGIAQGYTSLFEATIESQVPGAVFFVSTFLAGIALLLAIYILKSLNGQRMSEVTAEGAGRTDSNESEANETDVTSYL